MRRTRPCYFSRGLHEAAELTVRLRICKGKRRRVAREEQPIKIKVTRPSFFLGGGYHPTLKLSGITNFTFIISLTQRMDNI